MFEKCLRRVIWKLRGFLLCWVGCQVAFLLESFVSSRNSGFDDGERAMLPARYGLLRAVWLADFFAGWLACRHAFGGWLAGWLACPLALRVYGFGERAELPGR